MKNIQKKPFFKKKSSLLISFSFVTALLIGFSLVRPNSACAELVCFGQQSKVVGRAGVARKKDKAKRRARRKWKTRATRLFGARYNSWHCAKNREYACHKRSGTYRCKAIGIACSCFN